MSLQNEAESSTFLFRFFDLNPQMVFSSVSFNGAFCTEHFINSRIWWRNGYQTVMCLGMKKQQCYVKVFYCCTTFVFFNGEMETWIREHSWTGISWIIKIEGLFYPLTPEVLQATPKWLNFDRFLQSSAKFSFLHFRLSWYYANFMNVVLLR